MRMPIDTRRARRLGAIVDGFNERPPHPFAAQIRRGEEILEIADRLDEGGAAVEEIMHEAHELAAAFGDERVDRLVAVEEARPGALRHLERKRRRPDALIECV